MKNPDKSKSRQIIIPTKHTSLDIVDIMTYQDLIVENSRFVVQVTVEILIGKGFSRIINNLKKVPIPIFQNFPFQSVKKRI
ncbi:unnamed protein product [Rhizophagus irregularis]|nr:unnamed protein product [Rhizophagus irregularis]